jgi:aryl-alcohol dehydrogenase-like predicted oxidoreductase
MIVVEVRKEDMRDRLGRREFLQRVGDVAAVGLGGMLAAGADAATTTTTRRDSTASLDGLTLADWPRNKLGRTGFEVAPLSIGLASMGHALYTPEEFEPVVNAAIDAGVNYLDIAPNYDVAEERLGPVMAKRRKEVFLADKTEAPSRDGTLKLIETSLKKMRTDRLDLCHLHNVGTFETEKVLGRGGMLEGVQTAKDRGLVRFIGTSGHLNVGRFVPVLETGQIDVLMCAMNFVDHHTYNFEERVLPVARKHNVGIVAMKVLGGAKGGFGNYRHRAPGALSEKYYSHAIRYAMGIPGIATIVLGIKTIDELKQAIRAVRGYRPFTDAEKASVERQGRALAAEWRDHFGPVG